MILSRTHYNTDTELACAVCDSADTRVIDAQPYPCTHDGQPGIRGEYTVRCRACGRTGPAVKRARSEEVVA